MTTAKARVACDFRLLLGTILVLVVTARQESVASPIDVIFTLDPSQSSWSLSGYDTPGTSTPYQEQSPGSLSTSVSGHFLVNFDPTTDNPGTIQFIGGQTLTNGFFQLSSPYTALPGINGTGPPAPANIVGQTADGSVKIGVRDLTWNFSSGPLSPSSSTSLSSSYAATTTTFDVLSGRLDATSSTGFGHSNYTGASDVLTGGTWILSESAAGTGQWTLAETLNYQYVGGVNGGMLNAVVHAVATAQFSTPNIVTVVPTPPTPENPNPPPPTVAALGGKDTTGGVNVTLPNDTPGGTLTVQHIPDLTALTPQQISSAEGSAVFAAATASVDNPTPQIWEITYPPELPVGETATIVFNYNPALLSAYELAHQSELGIWHYSTLQHQWNFGGTVDVDHHQITFVTDSFSPAVLGFANTVPEPSSIVLLGGGLIAMLCFAHRRRRGAAG